ncbi:MAG: hypothetical protein Q8L37_04510 [Candidatus Gottesmanbacteria bacterium]|nr:hypothetical protein [Candidatus Gottesmanbacteria bacterium]
MTNYHGVIIEESLENNDVLKKVKILTTNVEAVTQNHKTPWLLQWTLHTVEISNAKAREIAEAISTSLDRTHGGSWFADFKNDARHYIIFRDKIYYIDRKNKEQYEEVKKHGIFLGIPKHQLVLFPL